MTHPTFASLELIEPLLRALQHEGYTQPTPIQLQAIPHVAHGRDLLGCAQTGTGKTAAFALPILQRLHQKPPPPPPPQGQASRFGRSGPSRRTRALILSPTRELAAQIGESFAAYGRFLQLHHTVIFGGVGQDAQTKILARGIDILVATPGRLLDLMGQGYVDLTGIEVFVLDEADRMLDMGFIHDVRRVIEKLPKQRQTLLFSATMPSDIEQLSKQILIDPIRVAVTPPSTTVERIEQRIYFVEKADKRALLIHLLDALKVERALVFTRTKHGANRVAEALTKARIRAEAIHGNKSQNARTRALDGFKRGQLRVLVATDIAARGIDIDDLTHVINFDLPNVPETYVHRIGRTGRAGAAGLAMSFCEQEEREYLVDIEREIQTHIPRADNYPHASRLGPPPVTSLERGHHRRPAQQQQRPQQQRHPHHTHGRQDRPRHGAPRPRGEHHEGPRRDTNAPPPQRGHQPGQPSAQTPAQGQPRQHHGQPPRPQGPRR
ncbi:MAG: DEAD/DEAH box helicase [Deltaproteobacteria bacterium]|nr:DEAD/DEAH box helicase [Deltaproteobacteria bacterium]